MRADNETWLLDAGDAVVTRRAAGEPLSARERLVYCLWVADYGMRNAGDLQTADDLHPGVQREALSLADDLGLRFTRDTFALPAPTFEAEYARRFDRICAEVRSA